jgi:hypothetical protein
MLVHKAACPLLHVPRYADLKTVMQAEALANKYTSPLFLVLQVGADTF